jgi:hypothetical protein
MHFLIKTVLPILIATIWISVSEFVRNQFFLKSYWLEHYSGLGLVFPTEPINGVIWGIWALCYAISIYIISKKFSFLETSCLTWFIGFILMWLVIGNMGVLPFGILYLAIPLSLLETFFACFIIKKLS